MCHSTAQITKPPEKCFGQEQKSLINCTFAVSRPSCERAGAEKVFVVVIDCSHVRSNVTGLRQTNIDGESVKRLSW